MPRTRGRRRSSLSPLRLIVLGAIVSANNFAASLALGALGRAGSWRRIVFAFVVFESLGTVAGLYLGQAVARLVGGIGTAVAALLLVGIGVWAATSPLRGGEESDDRRFARRATTWPGVVTLGLLLGLDNVAIGLGLGLGETAPLTLGLVVALATLVFASTGLWLGNAARRRFETPAVVAAGAALALVGVALVLGWL